MRLQGLRLLVVVIAAACSQSMTTTASTNYIQVENYQFVPMNDTLTAGSDLTATVTFVWENGDTLHNVTWNSGPQGVALPPNSQTLNGGSTYDATLQVGTYAYHCSLHVPQSMMGTIVVLPPAGM